MSTMAGSTPSTAQRFSAAPSPQPAGKAIWKRNMAWSNMVGFYAALYIRAEDGAKVLAFRGTDDLWDGLLDDTTIAVGGVPPQAAPALIVAQSAGFNRSSYLTGHSLGGALAIIAASHLGCPAATFNAPGVMDSCARSAPAAGTGFFRVLARCISNPRIMNKRINGDPVSSWWTTGFKPAAGQKACQPQPAGHSMRSAAMALPPVSQRFARKNLILPRLTCDQAFPYFFSSCVHVPLKAVLGLNPGLSVTRYSPPGFIQAFAYPAGNSTVFCTVGL